MNLVEYLIANATTRPTHAALVQDKELVTYQELSLRVARNATRLSEQGIERGDVVGLCLGDDVEHIVMLFALAMLGAIILPMDLRWQAVEKVRVASRFKAKFVLCRAGEGIGDGPPLLPIDKAWREART